MAKFMLYQNGDNLVAALRPQLVRKPAPLKPSTFGLLVAGWFVMAFVLGLAVLVR